MSHVLDEVTIRQYAWKTETMRSIAGKICKAAISASEFYPDTIDFDDVQPSDRNCIGMVFRTLRNLGLIEQTGVYRSSDSTGARGRIVFEYRTTRPNHVRAMLERCGVAVERPQMELTL